MYRAEFARFHFGNRVWQVGSISSIDRLVWLTLLNLAARDAGKKPTPYDQVKTSRAALPERTFIVLKILPPGRSSLIC